MNNMMLHFIKMKANVKRLSSSSCEGFYVIAAFYIYYYSSYCIEKERVGSCSFGNSSLVSQAVHTGTLLSPRYRDAV